MFRKNLNERGAEEQSEDSSFSSRGIDKYIILYIFQVYCKKIIKKYSNKLVSALRGRKKQCEKFYNMLVNKYEEGKVWMWYVSSLVREKGRNKAEQTSRLAAQGITVCKEKARKFLCEQSKKWAIIVRPIKEASHQGFFYAARETLMAVREQAVYHQKELLKLAHIAVPLAAIAILFCTVNYWNHLDFGLVLAYEGEEIATIETEEVFEKANQMVNQRLVYDEVSGQDFGITPSYKLAVVSEKKYATPVDVCDKLIQQSKGTIEEASGLYVDDKLVGVVKEEEQLDEILTEVLNEAAQGQDAEVSFVENVESVSGLYPATSIMEPQEMQSLVTTPVADEAYYTVKEGDAPLNIAADFNMSLDELQRINETNLEDLMYPDKQVKVQVAKTLLSVSVTVNESYDNSIPYETITTKDENEYKDYSETTQQGEDGIETCVDKVTYVNGIEVNREPISRTVTKQAVEQKVTVGTKERQSAQTGGSISVQGTGKSTGNLMWPIPYTRNITSPYGPRWGTFHWGIDISSGGIYGKDIVASDGGVVSFVQYSDYGYGNHLQVDHGDGIATLYAHCSAIYVTPGQRVSKGQPIAAVGNSGDSTGAHCHFEVRENGSKVNPLDYV